MSHNQKVGQWSELAGADYLSAKGYEIITRNVRKPYGEIYLIALKDGFTIFVEVNAGRSSLLGPSKIAVMPTKQQRMLSCAEHDAQQREIDYWQVEVIAAEKVNGKAELKHFENAI